MEYRNELLRYELQPSNHGNNCAQKSSMLAGTCSTVILFNKTVQSHVCAFLYALRMRLGRKLCRELSFLTKIPKSQSFYVIGQTKRRFLTSTVLTFPLVTTFSFP
ncbi:hypothetical protein LINGRAPRIM_LOCUS242, partial [Linum grandiflorum]